MDFRADYLETGVGVGTHNEKNGDFWNDELVDMFFSTQLEIAV